MSQRPAIKSYMLRHAHSIGNELGIIDSIDPKFDGLSEKGKKQAQELISKLSNYGVDAFIVSPLRRTIETLNPYLETLAKPRVVISEPTLERNAGEFTGQELGAIKKYCEENKILDRVSFKPKGGESILEVYERAEKFLRFLRGEFQRKAILICGHKNFLTCLEILSAGRDVTDFYSVKELENCEIREFSV